MNNIQNLSDNNFQKIMSSLTLKELKVLQMAKEGKGNKEIAAIFNISVETVKTHRKNIMRKMGIKGKIEMTRFLITLFF